MQQKLQVDEAKQKKTKKKALVHNDAIYIYTHTNTYIIVTSKGTFGTHILIFVCIYILAQMHFMFETHIYILLFVCICV